MRCLSAMAQARRRRTVPVGRPRATGTRGSRRVRLAQAALWSSRPRRRGLFSRSKPRAERPALQRTLRRRQQRRLPLLSPLPSRGRCRARHWLRLLQSRPPHRRALTSSRLRHLPRTGNRMAATPAANPAPPSESGSSPQGARRREGTLQRQGASDWDHRHPPAVPWLLCWAPMRSGVRLAGFPRCRSEGPPPGLRRRLPPHPALPPTKLLPSQTPLAPSNLGSWTQKLARPPPPPSTSAA